MYEVGREGHWGLQLLKKYLNIRRAGLFIRLWQSRQSISTNVFEIAATWPEKTEATFVIPFCCKSYVKVTFSSLWCQQNTIVTIGSGPTLLKGLRAIDLIRARVWLPISHLPRRNRTEGGKTHRFDSTALNKAGVETPFGDNMADSLFCFLSGNPIWLSAAGGTAVAAGSVKRSSKLFIYIYKPHFNDAGPADNRQQEAEESRRHWDGTRWEDMKTLTEVLGQLQPFSCVFKMI